MVACFNTLLYVWVAWGTRFRTGLMGQVRCMAGVFLTPNLFNFILPFNEGSMMLLMRRTGRARTNLWYGHGWNDSAWIHAWLVRYTSNVFIRKSSFDPNCLQFPGSIHHALVWLRTQDSSILCFEKLFQQFGQATRDQLHGKLDLNMQSRYAAFQANSV